MTGAIVDKNRKVLACKLAFVRVFRRNDSTAPKHFSRSFEDQRTGAGLLRAHVHRQVQLAARRRFAISVANSEGSSLTVIGLIAAFDTKQRSGNARHFRTEIRYYG